MEQDQIGCVLIPSRVFNNDHPGHMTVRFFHFQRELAYRGFYFDPSDLPDDCRSSRQFRQFLLANRIPGHIINDLLFAERCEAFGDHVLTHVVAIHAQNVIETISPSEARRSGWYSFNPDNFEDCHNCVTWAVDIINQAHGKVVLSRPHQGWIREMVKLLSAMQSTRAE